MNRINPLLKKYFEERAREMIRERENGREKNGDISFAIQIPEEMLHLVRDGDVVTLSNPAGEVYFTEDENNTPKRENSISRNLIGYFFPDFKCYHDNSEKQRRFCEQLRKEPIMHAHNFDVPHIPETQSRIRIYRHP